MQHPKREKDGIMIPQAGDHTAILLLHAFSQANAASGACFRYIAEALRSFSALDREDQIAMGKQLTGHDHGTKSQGQIKQLGRIIALKQQPTRSQAMAKSTKAPQE